jgi:hypothetical protein
MGVAGSQIDGHTRQIHARLVEQNYVTLISLISLLSSLYTIVPVNQSLIYNLKKTLFRPIYVSSVEIIVKDALLEFSILQVYLCSVI